MGNYSNVVAIEPNLVLRAILDWYFKHGGEGTGPHDPDWSRTPIGQIGVLTAIHELAARLGDRELGKQVQASVAKGIAASAGRLAA